MKIKPSKEVFGLMVLGPLSHMRLRARDHYTSSTSIGGKGEPVQVCFTLGLRDQRSMCMQDGCKVYVDSYMESNGSCFMVTCTIFKTHLLDVGQKQKQETMALRMLTTVDLACVRTRMNGHSLKWHLVEGPITHDFTPHYMILEVSWDGS